MDENNIIDLQDVANLKKKPWYKRAWNKVKKAWNKFTDWIDYWWDDVIFPILVFIYGITLGLVWGWIFGLLDKDNNKANYDAGKKAGCKEGYLDAMQDLKNSGYQVYGGYNEDCGKLIVTKLTEQAIEVESSDKAE